MSAVDVRRFCYEPRRGRPPLSATAAKELARGTGNVVYTVAGAPSLALRVSQPQGYNEAQGRLELGLIRLLADLGKHVPVVAGSADATGLRIVMPRLLSLYDHLSDLGQAARLRHHHLWDLSRQLLSVFCTVASLGLCLMDVKPGNFLYAEAERRVYVIDVEPTHVSYLDPDLLLSVEGDGGGPKRCQRAKGCMLYVMTLLMYRHLDGPQSPPGRASPGLAFFLRNELARSRVPWAALAALPCTVDPAGRRTLGYKLGLVAKSYFYPELDVRHALASFVKDGQALSRSGAAASPDQKDVVVAGVNYGRGGRCLGWARYDLRTFGARSSSCGRRAPEAHLAEEVVTDAQGKPLLLPLGGVALLSPGSGSQAPCPLPGAALPSSGSRWSSPHSSSSSPWPSSPWSSSPRSSLSASHRSQLGKSSSPPPPRKARTTSAAV